VKFHAAGGKWREISRHWREIIKISRQLKFFLSFSHYFLEKEDNAQSMMQNLNFFKL